MSNANDKIAKPVRYASDIGKVLGTANYNISVMCSLQRVNWASKNKPIRYPKYTSLTDSERIGTAQDNANGIFWGVKMATPASSLTDLHNVTFEYFRPRPGIDPARPGDFNGYNAKAVANPQGTIPSELWVDLLTENIIDVDYSTSNTDGVNLNDVIANTVSSSLSLGVFYPCALVRVNNEEWVRALWRHGVSWDNLSSTEKNKGFVSFQVDGQWLNKWVLRLDTDSENGTKEQPVFSDGQSVKVTIFFMRYISPQSMMTFDIRKWVKVSGSAMLAQMAYACPGAVGMTIPLKRYYTRGLEVTSASYSKLNNTTNATINLFYKWLNPKVGETYKLQGSISNSSGTIPVTSFTENFNYTSGDAEIGMVPIMASGFPADVSKPTYRLDWWVYVGTSLRNSGSIQLPSMT